MFCKERIAKAIRVLSVPPVMVSVLILILAFSKESIFRIDEEHENCNINRYE